MEANQFSYDLGIDLGTSNCALAFHRAEPENSVSGKKSKTPSFEIKQLSIAQIESPGSIIKRQTLPSALYIPRTQEIDPSDLELPWPATDKAEPTSRHKHAIGRWALQHGSLNPDRIIVSAKSWLCYDQVAREEPILPWETKDSEIKLSPLKVSQYFIEHLLAASSHELEDQSLREAANVVITVPASFDEVARALTIKAAQAAGIRNVTLLEEPLAAFYSWVGKDPTHWRDQIESNDLILVCDVGGGTSDFSLISAGEDPDGNLELERVSVGKHLLLGGDNMDLALAYILRVKLETNGHTIDQWQMESLRLAAREAKEKLLTESHLEEIPIAVASRGSSLFASSLATVLLRSELESIIIDGFFPACEFSREPLEADANALKEFGLPYEADPAITVHLASFLRQAYRNSVSDERLKNKVKEHVEGDEDQKAMLIPSKVLFNGGVFKASQVREKVLATLSSWTNKSIRPLEGADLDLSVSRGACYYAALKRTGQGLRIRSGSALSYYLGISSGMMAIPGYTPPLKGVCILPQGTEEGSHLELPDKEFGLVTGKEAEFQLFSSRERAGDLLGCILPNAEAMLERAARVTITLPKDDLHQPGEVIPVILDTHVSELGTMQLAMKRTNGEKSWKLEFDLRRQEH